ncbi:laccase 2 precursor [Mycena vulgaris]|nr:laccase 2 precursor [Mycena vulgaris]
MKFSSATLLLSIFSTTYGAIGPTATLTIANSQIAPDGFQRSSVLANGVFPGPLITANKSASFSLDVDNQLTDPTMLRSTSIASHWHGLFQQGSNWEDGPAFVTQCPIAANHSFQYSFDVPEQTGTYWWHSHLSTQYCDGLRGALVIYDSNDPAKDLYDDTVITLADCLQLRSHRTSAVPIFNSTLINGLGRYSDGPASPLAVISVQQGLRYRFRLVSISCDPNWIFSIDGHNMTIIEVDGVNHQPLTVDNIQIFAGQRYSFILNASQPVDNYWIRANPQLANSFTGFAGGINSAILRYVNAPVRDPSTVSTLNNALVETSLHPLVPTQVPGLPQPGGADVVLNLAIAAGPNFTFTFGGTTFVPPTAPVLLQILSGAQSAQDLLPTGSVYTLPPNKVIEISIPGGSAGAPHNFFVIRSTGTDSYNFVDPVIRDVVSTGISVNDNTTFRFVTDNAGPWFLHCHIDWHLDAGLAVVIAEDTATISKESPPPAWDELCPIYNNLTASQL